MKITDNTKEWLLKAEAPYVQFNTKQFFNIRTNREDLLNDPFIKETISLLHNWDREVLKNHSRPQLLIHKLALLADLGVKATDKPVTPVIKTILDDVDEDGIPGILIELPVVFGGSGVPEKAWMICDFPVILAALLKMDVKSKKIKKGLTTLQTFVSENGFRCMSAFPKVKGPGKKTDFCPYANLLAAKALSEDPESSKSKAARLACESLLFHWETRGQKKYFLFGIGTDFQKLKYPFVWYNILHMVEVLSRYEYLHKDGRFIEMVDVILGKAGEELKFMPESIYMIYKKEDFGNKKEYSRVITLAVLKILKRIGRIK